MNEKNEGIIFIYNHIQRKVEYIPEDYEDLLGYFISEFEEDKNKEFIFKLKGESGQELIIKGDDEACESIFRIYNYKVYVEEKKVNEIKVVERTEEKEDEEQNEGITYIYNHIQRKVKYVPENYEDLLGYFISEFGEDKNKKFIFKFKKESGQELIINGDNEACESNFETYENKVYVEEKKVNEIKVVEKIEEKEEDDEDKEKNKKIIIEENHQDQVDKEDQKEEEKEDEKSNDSNGDIDQNAFMSQLSFQVSQIGHNNTEYKIEKKDEVINEIKEVEKEDEEKKSNNQEEEKKLEEEDQIDKQMDILIRENRNYSLKMNKIDKENKQLAKKLEELKSNLEKLKENQVPTKKINYDLELKKLKDNYDKKKVEYENEISELSKVNRQLESQLSELKLASSSSVNIKKNKKNKKELLSLINENFKKEKLKRVKKNEENIKEEIKKVKIKEENDRKKAINKSKIRFDKLNEINKSKIENDLKNRNNKEEEIKENEELKRKKMEKNEILEKLKNEKTRIIEVYKTQINNLKEELEKERLSKYVYSYECPNIMYLQQVIYVGTNTSNFTVIMKNNGKLDWPKNKTKLVFDKDSRIKGKDVELHPLKIDEEKNYTVVIEGLSHLVEGVYNGNVWFNVNNKNYGKMLNLRVEIIKKKEDPIKKYMKQIEDFRAQFELFDKNEWPDERLYELLLENDFDPEKTFAKIFE